MKPKEAFLPFLKLIYKDYKNLLKTLLRYTSEADKRLYFKKKYKTDGLPYVDINDLVRIDEDVCSYTFLEGTSKPIDIALIKAICKTYDQCNYLEIGSWRGESLINISTVAKKCTSISLSKDEIISKGGNHRAASLQRLFTDKVDNITHIEANSLRFNFDELDERFNVIFIDGDHSYRGVKSDTENAFKLLKDEDSVIIWHDCGFGSEGYRYEVISAVLDGAPADKRDKIYRVTNTICGIYTNKQVVTRMLTSPQYPNKTFSMKLKSNPFEKTGN